MLSTVPGTKNTKMKTAGPPSPPQNSQYVREGRPEVISASQATVTMGCETVWGRAGRGRGREPNIVAE